MSNKHHTDDFGIAWKRIIKINLFIFKIRIYIKQNKW